MTKGIALRSQAAATYALVFLTAIIWIEVRYRLWWHDLNLLLPYALLIVATLLSAYAFSGLFNGDPGSPARAVRLVLVPLAIAATALFSTSTLWLLIGFAVSGKVSTTKFDLIGALPLIFIREAWFPLLAGLPAATWYLDVRRHRAHRP